MLVSAFNLSTAHASVPVLPPTTYGGAALAAVCHDNTHRVSLLFPAPHLTVPNTQVMSTQ